MEGMDTIAALAAVGALALIAFAVTSLLRLEKPWLQAWSLARAVAQLGMLALILRFVIERMDLVLVFLAAMIAAAASVVARRLEWRLRGAACAAAVIAVSGAVPVAVVFSSGAVPMEPRYVLALSGMVVGGVMTVSTLYGRALLSELRAQRDQVEAWLALGARPRQAALAPVRSAGSTALVPNTDQARVTGLVTLPGAFVGAVFGGLPVLEAAVFQLVVLAGLLAAGAIAVALWSLLLGAPRTLPRTAADVALE